MNPDQPEAWIAVARERVADAQAVQTINPQSVGSVYLAGYAIECSLKALLQKRGIPFPKSGQEGHNLCNLWSATGFRFGSIRDADGSQTFFFKNWSTNLRYTTQFPASGHTSEQLIEGAKKLSNFLQTEVRRGKRRHRQ